LREGRVARPPALHHGSSRLPQSGLDDRFTFLPLGSASLAITSQTFLGFPRYRALYGQVDRFQRFFFSLIHRESMSS
jgi:hypothetical protein